ncbi:MAG: hypothetical protein ACOYZ6_04615 [Chloroflexota bacterium]
MNTENTFPDAVNKHSNFLINLGFIVYEKLECDTSAFGNSYYRFKSEKVGIEIVLDKGQVLLKIGKISEDRRDWLEWSHVMKAYAPDVKAYDFDIDIEPQVKRISELAQQYCTKLLSGDFNDENLLRVIEDAYGKNFLRRFLQS